MDLYAVLGVPRDATFAAINKAHFRQIKALKPTPNDDLATKQRYADFETAYKVLRDPEMREKYDMNGINGISTNKFEFFQLLKTLESEDSPFRSILGIPPSIVILNDHSDSNAVSFAKLLSNRIVELELSIKQLLAPYLAGNERHFASFIFNKRESCNAVDGGGKLVVLIGKCYRTCATALKDSVSSILKTALSRKYNAPECPKYEDIMEEGGNLHRMQLLQVGPDAGYADAMYQPARQKILSDVLEKDTRYAIWKCVNRIVADCPKATDGILLLGKILSFAKGWETRDQICAKTVSIAVPPPPTIEPNMTESSSPRDSDVFSSSMKTEPPTPPIRNLVSHEDSTIQHICNIETEPSLRPVLCIEGTPNEVEVSFSSASKPPIRTDPPVPPPRKASC